MFFDKFFPYRKRPNPKRLAALQSEAKFLANEHTRPREVLFLARIALEFWRGFTELRGTHPAITVFGSARFPQDHPYCKLARQVGNAISREGYTVITGGGHGIMEATNQGAREAGGKSVGIRILLPREHTPNDFLDRVVTFYYFFVRKLMLVKYSYGFVILPGGMGTLDEMTEAMTLIQTGKIYDFPVILVGKDYWGGFLSWVKQTMVAQGCVSAEDLETLRLTDDPAEVASILRESARGIGLKLRSLASTVD